MKIAAIMVCFNDDYKLKEWISHYNGYKKDIYKLIIVDNGSRKQFIHKVKEAFSNATIIERNHNGGSTAAYNDGIRIALEDDNVDSILLIANDMKLGENCLKILHHELFKEENLGMVSPVLLKSDSYHISDCGCGISYCFYMNPQNVGLDYHLLDKKNNIRSESLTGGMNLSKKSFYKTVGLQDEKLFMYSDEVDMGIRARKKQVQMKVVVDAVAWHQHINSNNKKQRLPYTDYLIGRNKVYLGWKHYGFFRAFHIFLFHVLLSICKIAKSLLKRKNPQAGFFFLWGSFNGLVKNMKLPPNMRLC